MNSMVCVEVGDKKKYTRKRENTDCPYFNEVLQCDSIFQSRKVLGSITMDVGTVYCQPDHQLFNEWALLLSPEDMLIDEKGYIKFTISVLGKGEVAKIPSSIEDEKEGIKMNILSEGQLARYVCRVYKFNGFSSAYDPYKAKSFYDPQKKTLKSNISKDSNASNALDLYVELTFGNLTGATSIKKGTNSIEWNEQVTFLARFPPLFQKLLICIKEENSSRKNPTIAQHSLHMKEISHTGEEGFPPSFGPAYIHMVGEENFKGISFYVGQLLFSLETNLYASATSVVSGNKGLINIGPILKTDEGKEESESNLLLFCCIIQASLMDKKNTGNDAHLQLNFGPEIVSTRDALNKKSNKNIPDKSTKNKAMPQDLCDLINGQDKPCLWINSSWSSNFTYRVHQSNIMAKIGQQLEEELWVVSELLKKRKDSLAENIMDSTLQNLAENCRRGIFLLGAKPKEDGTRTILDWERLRLLRKELGHMQHTALVLRKSLNQNSVNKIKADAETLVSEIYSLVEDPQDPYPDVILSLIGSDRRLAYQKIKSRELIYSPDLEKCGDECGKKRMLFLKKMESRSSCDFPVTMAVEVYFWMGFSSEMPDDYLKGIPRGFSTSNRSINTDSGSLNSKTLTAPPLYLHFYEKHIYQLRAHMFGGRFASGSDESGLCDPYIKIIIGNNTNQTQVQLQTLNPLWDQMLIFNEITLYGLPDDVKSEPPAIILEAMDKDKYTKDEFIGRGLSVPCVKTLNNLNKSDGTDNFNWIELYNFGEMTGELLAAFELLELSDEVTEANFPKDLLGKSNIFHVPSYIRPKMVPYNLKVLFWGLRSFGKNKIINPQVTIEVGSLVVRSPIIANVKEYPNFASPIVSAELDLPENENYCPPLTIKVWDKRSFGRLVHIGSHLVSSASHFSVGDFHINWPVPLINETSLSKESEKSIADEHSDEISDDMENEPLLKAKIADKPHMTKLRVVLKEKKDKNENKSTEPEEKFDWWTKYYVSLLEKKAIEQHKGEIFASPIGNDESITTENYEGSPMNFEYEDLFPISDDIECNRSKHKKLESKSYLCMFLIKVMKCLRCLGKENGVSKKKASSKKKVENKPKRIRPRNKYQVKPASFVIYPNELERQLEFCGFQDWIDCFDIYHGKKHEYEDAEKRIVGKFKGLIKLKGDSDENNKREDEDLLPDDVVQINMNDKQEDAIQISIPTTVHPVVSTFNQTLKILVRVYVIRAYSLSPRDMSGRSDPYVVVSVGENRTGFWHKLKRSSERVSGDRSDYIEKNLNPVFGRCHEVVALLPRDNTLTVRVMDWDMGGQDDLIGITEIDIENRIYSRHRATCGISSSFRTCGYNNWRDPQKPSDILESLCRNFNMDSPVYEGNEVTVGQRSFILKEKSKTKNRKDQRESLALTALKRWSEVILPEGNSAWSLVPEHIETRSLYDPKMKGIEQGKLEMWVDLFCIPKELENKEVIHKLIGPPVDISPRQPKSYELRVIIWNTADVELCDTNILLGEKSSDIFVKGWLYGPDVDSQTTDVHYHSLSGEGNFNWRFVFPFMYVAPEKSLVIPNDDEKSSGKKAIRFMKSLFGPLKNFESGEHIPCRLQLQVWDQDHFSPNDFIGAITLEIESIPIGSKTAMKCNPVLLREGHPRVDLFKARRIRGWWPVTRMTDLMKKSKNEYIKMTGKIEAELELLTKDEAEVHPAGRGREEPFALPKPKRPDTSFTWFRNPMKILKFAIWKNYRKTVIKWTLMFLMVLFIFLGLYSLPGYLIKRMLGA